MKVVGGMAKNVLVKAAIFQWGSGSFHNIMGFKGKPRLLHLVCMGCASLCRLMLVNYSAGGRYMYADGVFACFVK